jgi:hypothetical protein
MPGVPDARYQGAYAEAYMEALALAAGLNVAIHKVDDGIDLLVRYTGDELVRSWPGIDLQVKSWTTPTGTGEFWSYDRLNEKQYNKLATPDKTHPRYLVVILVPADRSRLAEVVEDGLLLRHRAYFAQVPGPVVENPSDKRRKRVLVPKRNVLTAAKLRELVHPALVAPRSPA